MSTVGFRFIYRPALLCLAAAGTLAGCDFTTFPQMATPSGPELLPSRAPVASYVAVNEMLPAKWEYREGC
jgi:hypothetical protein